MGESCVVYAIQAAEATRDNVVKRPGAHVVVVDRLAAQITRESLANKTLQFFYCDVCPLPLRITAFVSECLSVLGRSGGVGEVPCFLIQRVHANLLLALCAFFFLSFPQIVRAGGASTPEHCLYLAIGEALAVESNDCFAKFSHVVKSNSYSTDRRERASARVAAFGLLGGHYCHRAWY